MSTTRLYSAMVEPGVITLAPEEHHHAANVLRARIGDAVVLFDGRGTEGQGHVSRLRRRNTEILVESTRVCPFDASVELTLGVAMPKTARQGYLIEKCTELGVAAFLPVLSRYSVAVPGGAALTKWRRRAIDACRQAGRAWLPRIEQPVEVSALADVFPSHDAVFLADVVEDGPSLATCASSIKEGGKVLVLIGPEGGWTDQESATLVLQGATCVQLGPTILRTETAALAASALVCCRHYAQE